MVNLDRMQKGTRQSEQEASWMTQVVTRARVQGHLSPKLGITAGEAQRDDEKLTDLSKQKKYNLRGFNAKETLRL